MPVALELYDAVLALHIAVVVAFGVTFAYPIMYAAASRSEARSLPAFHRLQAVLGQRLVSPGLAVVVIAGIYLASKGHSWSEFWVQWGLGAAIVIGGVGGAYLNPRERRLAEIAERDVGQSAGGGAVSLSQEYRGLARQVGIGSGLMSLLVLVTVFVMTAKPFS